MTETKKPELLPCPICGEAVETITPARLVLEGDKYVTRGGEFHLSFALYDKADDTVVHNFHSGQAVICENCNLVLPGFYEESISEMAERWNDRPSPKEQEAAT